MVPIISAYGLRFTPPVVGGCRVSHGMSACQAERVGRGRATVKPVPVRSMLKMGLRWIEALQVGEGGAGVPVDVEGALL